MLPPKILFLHDLISFSTLFSQHAEWEVALSGWIVVNSSAFTTIFHLSTSLSCVAIIGRVGRRFWPTNGQLEVNFFYSWAVVFPKFWANRLSWIVSVRVKTLSNTNLVASGRNMENSSVPVDVREIPTVSYGPKAWKSNPLSWRSLPVQVIIGSTPRDLKPFQFYMTLICFISVCHLYPVYLTGSSGNLDEMISNKRNNVCGLMCFSSGRRLVVWLVFGGFHWQKGYKRVPYPCKNRQSYDCFKILANFLAN